MASFPRASSLHRIALYAFVVAFALRLLWGLAIPVIPLSDSNAYDVFAQNLAEGYGYGWERNKPSAYWPVGTSAIYALSYRLLGHSYAPIVFLQVLVGVAVVVVATSLARRWFDDAVAAATAWILACWPVLVEYTTILASELFFLLFVTAAYRLALVRAHGAAARGAWAGLSLAAANYVRPIALLIPPLLFLKEAAAPGRRRAATWACIVCAVAMVVAIAPWTLRNWQAFDRLVIMSTNGGRILWMGNNPDADTGYMKLPKLDVQNEADLDRILGQRAREYILKEPLAFFQRSLKKALVLHDRETIGIVWNEGGISKRLGASALTPLKVVSSAYWWAVLVLAIYGTFALARIHAWSVVLVCPPLAAWVYFTLVHSITIAGDRYHIPSIPFVAMLAAYAAIRLLSRLRRQEAPAAVPLRPTEEGP